MQRKTSFSLLFRAKACLRKAEARRNAAKGTMEARFRNIALLRRHDIFRPVASPAHFGNAHSATTTASRAGKDTYLPFHTGTPAFKASWRPKSQVLSFQLAAIRTTTKLGTSEFAFPCQYPALFSLHGATDFTAQNFIFPRTIGFFPAPGSNLLPAMMREGLFVCSESPYSRCVEVCLKRIRLSTFMHIPNFAFVQSGSIKR